ncbi:hypothetical protein SDC9_21395 [bioreactor metagenome]|uniref:Uncharacterized protein n=1 Tax=bioreactor metagenome TaxID=1076179 RepID=A0A644U9E7_9ZZZZ
MQRLERGERVDVFGAGFGIGAGGAAAGDRLRHLELGCADAQAPADEVALGPGRPAFDPEIAAEAVARHWRAGRGRKRLERGERQDRDIGLGHVGERHPRHTLDPARGRAVRGPQRRQPGDQLCLVLGPVGIDGEGPQLGMDQLDPAIVQRPRAHRHQPGGRGAAHEVAFRRPFGERAAKARLRVRDGPEPVKRHGAPLVEERARDVLVAHRLDRVAHEMRKMRRHFFDFSSAALLRKPDLMLSNSSGRFPCIDMIVYCWMKVMVLLLIQ